MIINLDHERILTLVVMTLFFMSESIDANSAAKTKDKQIFKIS